MGTEQPGLLSRRQIADVLQQRFYVTQQADSLRTIFSRLGIQKIAMGTDPDSGRGQVAFYDPLVVWVMATYFHWPRLSTSSPYEALRSCMSEALERRGNVGGPETARLAYYLFIADARWGIDLRVLDSALASDPSLLGLTLDGPDVLKSVLVEYKTGVLSGMVGRPIEGVRLASDYEREFIEGFGDAGAGSWPFFGTNGGRLLSILAAAGLYDPSRDESRGDMEMLQVAIDAIPGGDDK